MSVTFTTRAVKRCIEVGQSYSIRELLQDVVFEICSALVFQGLEDISQT